LKKALAIGAIALALSLPNAAFADEPESPETSQNEQVIPPTVTEDGPSSTEVEPIDVTKIKITNLTPADEFSNAITPLVLALGIGSIALVIYTLTLKPKG